MFSGQKLNWYNCTGFYLDSSDASLSDQYNVYVDTLSLSKSTWSIVRHKTELEDDGESSSKETFEYEESDSYIERRVGSLVTEAGPSQQTQSLHPPVGLKMDMVSSTTARLARSLPSNHNDCFFRVRYWRQGQHRSLAFSREYK